MRWLDRHGRPLPLDDVFDALLQRTKQRAGGMTSRVIQRRHRRASETDVPVLLVRTANGTRVYEEQDAP